VALVTLALYIFVSLLWSFIHQLNYVELGTIFNPHLAGLKIVPNSYKFIVNGTDDVVYIDNTYIDSSLRNLISFFEYLCWKLCWVSGLTGRFSHFERIDDQTYRIHMKKKS
jgi:hypothetical protein